MLAFIGNMGYASNNQAKAMALLWGLKFSLSIGIKWLIIEGESMLIVDTIKGNRESSWGIGSILMDIRAMLMGLEEFRIHHIFREGNVVADSLAAIGIERVGVLC